jgi:hypothetical protein
MRCWRERLRMAPLSLLLFVFWQLCAPLAVAGATPGSSSKPRKGAAAAVSKVSRAEIQKSRRARLVAILPAMESVLGRLHELGGVR